MDFDCPMNTALAGIQATEDFYKEPGYALSSLKGTGCGGEERLEEMAVEVHQHGKAITLPGIQELGKGSDDGNFGMALGSEAGTEENPLDSGESRVWRIPAQKDNGHRRIMAIGV